MATKKDASLGQKWLEELGKAELQVTSARDALLIRGWLDTGNYALNWAISGRLQHGYPLGHCVEIYGDPATGKSFIAARALGMAQEQGGVALLDDVEAAYNLDWIGNLGIDAEALAYEKSRTVKQHLEVATGFVKAYASLGIESPGLIVCDSTAALSTDHELETRLDKRDMSKAGEMKSFFRIMGGDLSDRPLVHLSTNHTIANIGDYFNKKTTSGGGGSKFHTSVRLEMKSPTKIKSGNDYTGVICKVFVAKNRIVAPWKEVRLAIPFYKPIAQASGLIPLLLEFGVLSTEGNFLVYDGRKLSIRAHKSKDSFLKQDEAGEALLDDYPELLEETDLFLEKRDQILRPWANAEIDPEARETEPDPPEVHE